MADLDNPFLRPMLSPPTDALRAAPLFNVKATGSASGAQHYVLVKQAPAVPAELCELADVEAVRVDIFWKDTLLDIHHLRSGETFTIGDGLGETPDFVVPSESLQVPLTNKGLWALVTCTAGASMLMAPSGAVVELAEHAGAAGPAADAAADPLAPLLLDRYASAVVTLDSLRFCLQVTRAGKPTPRAMLSRSDRRVPLFFGLSALVHGALVASMMAFVPPLGLLDDEGVDKNRVYLMQAYLEASAEREVEPTETPRDDSPTPAGGETAEAHHGEPGAAGKLTADKRQTRLAVQGDAPSLELARDAMIDAARNFGMIGLLTSMIPEGPTSPFGADIPSGFDAVNADGGLWGDPGDSFGFGGLSLSGPGRGGGGLSDQIGLAGIGVCPGGFCTALERGFGRGRDHRGPGHQTKAPQVRSPGNAIVSGRLAPEVIQRIVRQNYGRFRYCYEQGLQRNPNLAGRVTARFVIDRGGRVARVQLGGSDLPDSAVVSCVLGAYQGLSFPSPEDGIVTVMYPIVFSPAG